MKPSIKKLYCSRYPDFDVLWKDTLSFCPSVPIDWKEREKMRVFAEEIHAKIMAHLSLRDLLEAAYKDGYETAEYDLSDD